MRRRFSRKRAALEAAFKKPWAEVALEWDGRPMNLREIASAWNAVVSPQFPQVNYSFQDVSDIIRAAKAPEGAAEVSA